MRICYMRRKRRNEKEEMAGGILIEKIMMWKTRRGFFTMTL